MTSAAEPRPSGNLHLPGYAFVERIYQGRRTTVYRALETSTQQSVVVKALTQSYPNFSELIQFRNQYTVAKNLPIEGIIHPMHLKQCGNSYALIMEDFGGTSLDHYASQAHLSLTDILTLAIQLADILHQLHRHRVIHKDIKPANILIHPDSKQIKLIDFSIASLLPKETQSIQSLKSLEGTLAYLAPEQTGRMNRAIDYRTDFYSLGVTLYQLLTDQLPFPSEDPLELLHCHMTQRPVPPSEVTRRSIPNVLSNVVLRLMAKNAENRYQSALGLKYDLEQCLIQWQEKGDIVDFALGQKDISERFLIPEKLYGRQSEVSLLLDAFERVVDQGTVELMLVAGYSGIGKTAVINEVHRPILRQRGYFIKGKFDQFNRNIPFSAFVQALQALMAQLLSESDAQLNTWKIDILAAVGQDGQVLIDVIPELEQIIGPQPPVIELSGSAVQTRFNRVFCNFIGVFTTADHPLVIFLDDLQWADTMSLQLLKLLAENSHYLLLIGAYRDNEVSSNHPFLLTLEDLKQTQVTVNTITLPPLAFKDTNRLIADTLNCSLQLAGPLTELIAGKTKGNPFFTTQFLRALHDDNALNFDLDQRHWTCDIAQIKAMVLTDDVVEFMVLQLQKLSVETQQVLKLAACIGSQFDLNTLAIVLEKSPDIAAQILWQSLQEGFVVPTSQIYKFFQSDDAPWHNAVNPTYQFLHDRIQQAAYYLIPDEQRQLTHLKIGQLLLNGVSDVSLEDNIFTIVNHWNMGAALVTDTDQQGQLCQLNLTAAQKAKGATAYGMAYEYAITGINLLTPETWQDNYGLTLTLHELATEAAYLQGDFEQSRHWARLVLHHAQTVLDEVKVHETTLLAYTAQKKPIDAIDLGIQILERLNISIPNPPTQADIQQAWADVSALIAQTEIQSLLDLPPMTDGYALAALRILNSMAATVYLTQPQLFPLIVLAQVKLSLLHGNTPVSAGAYARYSFILCSKVDDIELGYEFGRLALTLSEQFNNKAISTRVLLMVGALTLPWKIHLRESIPLLKTAYLHGIESGNLDGAALSHYYESQSSYLVGEKLQGLADKVATYSQQIHELKQALHLNNNELLHQVILNLIGDSTHPCELVGSIFDENKMLPLYRESSNVLGLYCLYLHKTMLCYWFGQGLAAVTYANEAANYLAGSTAQATVPLLYFYDSLARLTQYATASPPEQEAILAQVSTNQGKLDHWVNHAPVNFQHKYDLVLAEQHHYLGEISAAIDVYDRAISGARANGYLQEEAMANELAAKFYLAWGKEKIAAVYMQEAYYCYSRWEAKAKVADLESRYPELLRPILQSTESAVSILDTLKTVATSISPVQGETHLKADNASVNQVFDLVNILQASQALASAIQLDELLQQLTQIILQNSGGDRCALILPDETGNWQVRAIATPKKTQLYNTTLTNNSNLPIKLIQYVKNSRDVVVIDNLATDLPVVDDYLRDNNPKSLVCLPILNQGHLIGLLYLTNQLTSGVFTRDRITVLNFLCTQTAISLENARLYQLEKNRSAQLAASENRLKTLFDQSADAVFLIGEQKIIDCNQAAVNLLRYPNKTDLLDLQPHQISPKKQPDGQLSEEKIKFMFLEASQRCSFRFEWVHQRFDGETFWAEITLTPIKYQGDIIFHCITRDISDRKKLEKEQARLTAVLEATSDFIGIASAQGKILWHNKPLRNLRADLIQPGDEHSISDCHPDWVNEIIMNEALPQAMQYGSWSGELALLDGGGREIPVSQVIIAHRAKSGDIENFSTVMRDISDRKAAENSLRISELKFRTLLSNLDGVVYRCQNDADWTMEFMSDAITVLSGYPVSDFIRNQQRTYASIIHPDDLAFVTDEVDRALELRQPFTMEYRILHQNGSVRWVTEKGKRVFDGAGDLEYLEGVIVDISDRKAAEQKLQESQIFLKTVLDTFPLSIFWKDRDSRYIGVNQNFAQDAGLKEASEIAGLTDFDMPWAETEAEGYRADDHEVIMSDAPKLGIIETQIQADGTQVWVETNKLPLHDLNGNVIGVMGTYQDISDRKRAEDAVLQKTRDLEKALTDLQNAQLQLVQSEKMSALGGLVSGVAHEINNPISCIIGNVNATRDYINDLLGLLDLYGEQFPEPGPDITDELDVVDLAYVREDLPQLIRAMKDSSDRITAISKGLRTFSRADTVTKQSFDIHEGLESTALILRHRLKANENRPAIEVVKYYGHIPPIDCFPGQLNQVFMNILANAIDALDENVSPSCGFADLKNDSPCIVIRTQVDPQQVTITIADNGPGIPEEIKDKIFDYLFTTKDVGKGTGLGLAIAHQIIVDTHGGSLEVRSEVGQGTEFCIRLPIS